MIDYMCKTKRKIHQVFFPRINFNLMTKTKQPLCTGLFNFVGVNTGCISRIISVWEYEAILSIRLFEVQLKLSKVSILVFI